MRKSTFVFLMAVLTASRLFAGAQTETKPDLVKLQVWYALGGAAGENFSRQAQEFDAARPDIELELTYSGSYADTATKVSAALMANDYPDVAVMAAGQLYTGARGDFSMEDLVKDETFNLSDIYPGMLDYGKFEGRVAALPYGISTQVLYYNKDIITAAGLDLETNPPKTWEQFLTVAKTAQQKGNTKNSPEFFGFDTSDGVWLFKSMLGQSGNDVVQKINGRVTPVFNDNRGTAVGTFWKRLIDERVMPAGQHNNAENKFLAGNLAFIAATSGRISRWTGTTSFTLGAIPMPAFERSSIALGGNVAIVLTKDKYKHAAGWEFLKNQLLPKNQTAFALASAYLPVNKSAGQDPVFKAQLDSNPLYKVAFDQLSSAWAYYHFNEMGTMDSLFWTALDEIEKNISSPKQALDKAAADLAKEIAEGV
jgi:sn-glycerol 3-phosphate transport system substrate-binding protein